MKTNDFLIAHYEPICTDIIKGFDFLKSNEKDNHKWVYHSTKPIGNKSMFAKVYDITNNNDNGFVLKSVEINEYYTIENAKNEVKIQNLASQYKITPKLIDSFICKSRLNDEKREKEYVFLIMEKKQISLKQFFKLLPQVVFSNQEFLDYDSNQYLLIKTIVKYCLKCINKMKTLNIFHNDIHLGNIMFDCPLSTLNYLQLFKQEYKEQKLHKWLLDLNNKFQLGKYESSINLLFIRCLQNSNCINEIFNLKSIQIIDFGQAEIRKDKSNTTDETDLKECLSKENLFFYINPYKYVQNS